MARDRVDDYPPDNLGGPIVPPPSGGLNGFFANTPVVLILTIVGIFCCPIIWVILGLVGVMTCTNPLAKKNATIMLVVDGIAILVLVILNFTIGLANFAVNRP